MFKLPSLIYRNKLALPSLPQPGTFAGSSILITGASGGLGLATAVHFVNLGASSVTITARSNAKGEGAKAAIEAQTNTVGKGIVKFLELDMSTLASTKEFVSRLKGSGEKVDYVLLNAGILNREWQEGKDGFEETIQVNVLSTALLGLLLLPLLKEGGGEKEKHMVFVTSGLHRSVDIDGWPKEDVLDYLSKKENWPKGGIYGTSKLLEQYVVSEIAKLGEAKVVVNSMCPGMVKSDLGRQYKNGILMSFGVDMFMTIALKSTEGGARSLVLAAYTTPEENGKYITHYQSDEEYKVAAKKCVFSPEAKQMQAEVWKEVLAMLEKQVPEIKEIARM